MDAHARMKATAMTTLSVSRRRAHHIAARRSRWLRVAVALLVVLLVAAPARALALRDDDETDWMPAVPGWIDVDLSEQWLTAYERDTPVFGAPVSTGIDGYNTPDGEFAIEYMTEWQDMWGDDYYLPDVPYVMYFADYVAIHGTYWHDNFGYPMSHGCVNLSIADAAWLYDWASVGTPVFIHY